MKIDHGHHVAVKFLGPTNHRGARWVVSWEGWPSEGSRRVRRYLPFDHERHTDRTELAADVVPLFIDWLNDAPGESSRRYTIAADRVTIGSASDNTYAFLVHTETYQRAAA